MMQCVNRDYEGDIKSVGDTIYIKRFGNVSVKRYDIIVIYDNLDSPMSDLLID